MKLLIRHQCYVGVCCFNFIINTKIKWFIINEKRLPNKRHNTHLNLFKINKIANKTRTFNSNNISTISEAISNRQSFFKILSWSLTVVSPWDLLPFLRNLKSGDEILTNILSKYRNTNRKQKCVFQTNKVIYDM